VAEKKDGSPKARAKTVTKKVTKAVKKKVAKKSAAGTAKKSTAKQPTKKRSLTPGAASSRGEGKSKKSASRSAIKAGGAAASAKSAKKSGKTTVKGASSKQTAGKKVTSRKAGKKVPAKKALSKKTPAKKAPAKKAPVKKTGTAKDKKTTKASPVRVVAKRPAVKKTVEGPTRSKGKKIVSSSSSKTDAVVVSSTTTSASAAETPKVRRLSSRRLTSEVIPPTPAVADIAPYEAKLVEKRSEALALYEQDVKLGLAASKDGMDDIVDKANDAYSRELTFAISDGERKLLELIDEALERIASGEYGHCKSCRRPIAELRLQAIPWARYCIDCQELEERGLLRD
jgi:RNA polymerase-binding protein DksA